jgi:Bacterial PH domain
VTLVTVACGEVNRCPKESRPARVSLSTSTASQLYDRLVFDLLIHVRKIPNSVLEYLMPEERICVGVRRHPLVILFPVILTVAGLIVALALTTGIGHSRGADEFIWLLWAALLLWAGWKVTDWRLTYFIVTENRLMLVTGVVGRSIAMLPLQKVTDMRLSVSATGRALGYGQFIVESAGQEQALRNIRFVPYPRQLYQEILALTFPRKSPPSTPAADSGF